MCPPLGAVAVLVFALPAAPASKPLSVAAGFLFGSIAVYAVYTLVGENFLKDFGGTRALLVGAAIAAMKITDSVVRTRARREVCRTHRWGARI